MDGTEEEDGAVDVGARLRALRTQHGLSQRELAERAGVPHGQVSMVETGRSSPTVASLRKILSGLGLSMAEFFDTGPADPPSPFVPADRLRDLTPLLGRRGAGRITLRQAGDARAHGLQILHETYAPGADTGETMLEHRGAEGGVITRGRIELTVGEETRILRTGDAYLFDSRQPHRFRNPGPEEAEIVSACTPPWL
ncbi:HTH-type transcriptional regulator PuuR [Jannaschia aquimarina]|uniref:PuuR_1 protein n=2 Tax=Jannaschia aquimarina TaxID=935700 RepID=A0A0D1EJF6_9RHOB|nr:HTH-type transcriptional regulator PuuR [Jannaschia aquimarina]SNS47188.1 transcriptional regulator, XRE family with cupin sensor [Jannaschia aquimarina]